MAYDVFISHSSKDKTVADATCAFLESKGIRCWIAPRDVRPGANWGASILKAIRETRVMVLIFSSHANASPQITREVERAINAGATVIPFRIEDILPRDDLDYFLSTPHWLDAFTPPLERHLEKLAAVIHEILEITPPRATVQQDAPEPTAASTPRPKTQRIPELTSKAKQGDEPEPSSSKKPLFNLIAVLALLFLAGYGYYYGVAIPAGKARQAEIDSQEAEVAGYRVKAEAGDVASAEKLGVEYLNGWDGVQSDNTEAFKWFKIAADGGNPDAQYEIGYMFENNVGVAQSIPTAVDWYKKAAANNDSYSSTMAQAALKRLGY